MAYIDSISDDEATGPAAEMLAGLRASLGHVPNYGRAFAHRPEVYAAWAALNGAIKASMDLRRYELATVAAAVRLRSSYCSLSHGSVLAGRFMAPERVRELVADHGAADLDPVDVAVMDFAEAVAGDATRITQADVDRLRSLGLSDADIFDVAAAAAARCFFSTALDALGVEPDASYSALDPGLREALTVGRPIARE